MARSGVAQLLGDGDHTFMVKATDAAGNTHPTPAQFTWTVDATAPSSMTTFPASATAYNASGWNAGCATVGFCGTYSDATTGVQKVEISIRRGAGNYWNGSGFSSGLLDTYIAARESDGDGGHTVGHFVHQLLRILVVIMFTFALAVRRIWATLCGALIGFQSAPVEAFHNVLLGPFYKPLLVGIFYS